MFLPPMLRRSNRYVNKLHTTTTIPRIRFSVSCRQCYDDAPGDDVVCRYRYCRYHRFGSDVATVSFAAVDISNFSQDVS